MKNTAIATVWIKSQSQHRSWVCGAVGDGVSFNRAQGKRSLVICKSTSRVLMFPPSLPVQQGITGRVFLGNKLSMNLEVSYGVLCKFSCFLPVFNSKSFRILFWTINPCTSENGSAHFSLFTNPTLIMCFAVSSKKDTDICVIWGYHKEVMLFLLPQNQW